MNSLIQKCMKYSVFILTLFCGSNAYADDNIISLSTNEIIGYKETPIIYVELTIDKTRDLYVAFQNMDGWQTVKTTMKRIKKSGKYHFEVPIEDLKVGKYRVDAYITPKGKNWNDRLNETHHVEFEVINQEKHIKQTVFSEQDRVKFVDWPKNIVGTQEATLTIKYDITEPRDLHIKLLDSSNWKEYGALKFPVTEPGDFVLPLSHLSEDFPSGAYAWVVYLTPTNELNKLSKEYGKHFVLKDTEQE